MESPGSLYKQSGTVPFRFADGELQIMPISRHSLKRWIIPKGIVDRNLGSSETACKEIFREAGVGGRIIKPAAGNCSVIKRNRKYRVKVYLLFAEEILDSWQEESCSKRIWIPADEAEKFFLIKESC